MGAIQSALNGAIGSAAVVVGAGKHIKQQAETNKQQAELIKQSRETQKNVQDIYNKYGTPDQYISPGAKGHDQNKVIQAMTIMSNNQTPKAAQMQNYSQKLEASKGVIKASRKKIGGRK